MSKFVTIAGVEVPSYLVPEVETGEEGKAELEQQYNDNYSQCVADAQKAKNDFPRGSENWVEKRIEALDLTNSDSDDLRQIVETTEEEAYAACVAEAIFRHNGTECIRFMERSYNDPDAENRTHEQRVEIYEALPKWNRTALFGHVHQQLSAPSLGDLEQLLAEIMGG